MAMIGSAAFGCVVGWAACFASGWQGSILLVRLLWAAIVVLLFLAVRSEHLIALLSGLLIGALGHLIFVYLIRNGSVSQPVARGALP